MKPLFCVAVVIWLIADPVSGQVPGCSVAQAAVADENIDKLRTWADLFVAFQRFHACDDGAIAEGWSDFIGRMLAKNWRAVGDLQRLVVKTQQFHRFVIRHIDETIPADHLRLIIVNARERCPRKVKALCKEIGDAARF